MRSNSFEAQKIKETGWKEAGGLRGFPILGMGIMEDVFQMKGKECEVQERFKKKIHARARVALTWDRQLCLGQWQWTRRDWRQPQVVQWERKENRRTSETP